MTTTTTSKAVALAGISILIAGGIAVFNSVTQGVLYEREKAKAEREKAAAMVKAAEATLSAAQEQARGIIVSAQTNGNALTNSAAIQARALIESINVQSMPDNSRYTGLEAPMLVEPAKKMTALNEKLVSVRREINAGINRATGKPLTDSQIAEKMARKEALEEELSALKETTSKNWGDSLSIVMATASQAMGAFGISGAEGGYSVPASRNPRNIINVEK